MPVVLTADDSAAIQRVVQVSLSPYAIDIVNADSFPAALDKAGTQPVDLIIAAAELGGTETLADLHRLTNEGKIPIIVLLSSYSKIDKKTLAELGFQQVLQKPFDSQELLQLVAFNLQLHLDEERNGNWQPFPTATTPPPEDKQQAGASASVSNNDGVDHNFALLVKQAVFEYCQNNFSRIAREMVLEEIRRLQNEKSDPVVSA